MTGTARNYIWNFWHPVVNVKNKVRSSSKCTNQKLLEMIQVTVPIFFLFWRNLNLKGVMAKELLIFYHFYRIDKKKIRFSALAHSLLGFRQSEKKFGTVTWIISNNFCFVHFDVRQTLFFHLYYRVLKNKKVLRSMNNIFHSLFQ